MFVFEQFVTAFAQQIIAVYSYLVWDWLANIVTCLPTLLYMQSESTKLGTLTQKLYQPKI
jgi:hypothetical protein